MNKAAIQRFAIQARTDLIDQVSQRAYQYGITKDSYGEANAVTVGGRALNTDEQRQRKELVEQIRQKGYMQVMEEVAYTWFNRFIALRFMEVNNYLPSHIRIFSDSTGAFKPEILNDALHLDMPGLNMDKVAEYIEKNQTEALYRYLLLTQCNALNDALPQMFEKLGGFSELLLPNNILKQDSVLGRMVMDIPEEDWTDQVQIIGWLYQFYNTELKAEVFGKSGKIAKNEIPAVTQLFTPDWLVRYMVENSLGRLWQEGHPDDELKAEWKYYLDEAQQEADVQAQLEEIRAEYSNIKPQDIKVIDPCMGSGHILVYAFDVLVQIYKKYGISERDAAQSILEYNLYGLDIDDRAAQLAYFAVMMKARQYDRRIFSRGIQPHVYSIFESNGLDNSTIEYFANNDPKLKKDFGILVDELRDAKEYGSILNISQVDFSALYARMDEVLEEISIFREVSVKSILPFIHVAEVMAQKYSVVVTNPPYLQSSGMNSKLSDYLAENYPDSKWDLFAVFIERCGAFLSPYGLQAMVTMHSWMTLGTYEDFRLKMSHGNLINMAHLGKRAFEEINGDVVQTTSWVQRNISVHGYKSIFIKLTEYLSQNDKERGFFVQSNKYIAKRDSFLSIPGSPYAYWVCDSALKLYANSRFLSDEMTFRRGISTGANDAFLRLWYEIDVNKSSIKTTPYAKWVAYNKGGSLRKWYGNRDYVVLWENDGAALKAFRGSAVRNVPHQFKPCISYSSIATGKPSFRVFEGFINDQAGNFLTLNDCSTYSNEWILGLLNSTVSEYLIEVKNTTQNITADALNCIPLVVVSAEMQVMYDHCTNRLGFIRGFVGF